MLPTFSLMAIAVFFSETSRLQERHEVVEPFFLGPLSLCRSPPNCESFPQTSPAAAKDTIPTPPSNLFPIKPNATCLDAVVFLVCGGCEIKP